MATIDNDSYFIVKNDNGIDYLCPLNPVKGGGAATDSDMDDCVEKDVVERYSGNINIMTA